MKQNKKFLFGVFFSAFFIMILLIIHSCKKDINKSQSANISPQAISSAKQWYDSNFPANPKYTHSIHSVNSLMDTAIDLSQFAHPDWSQAVSYMRDADSVLEVPIQASDEFSNDMRNATTGANYNKNYTHSSFLLLKNGNTYSAYIMTIIADSAYLNNDLTKLAHNTYRYHDADFTGLVLYYTPKGDFISGWGFKNGNLIVSGDSPDSTSQTQNIKKYNNTFRPNLVAAPPAQDCTSWYQVVWHGDEIISITYLYTVCTDLTTSGSTSPAPPPPPCTTTPSGGTVQGYRHPVVSVAAPLPGGGTGTGGGMPPPTKTQPCAVTTKVLKDTTLLKVTNLTLKQKDSLQAVLTQILNNCIGQALNNYFEQNSVSFPFVDNPKVSTPATYNPTSNTITVNSVSTLSPAALEEELFHGYQNKTMPGGTAQYAGKSGSANIEFEAKVLRDMNSIVNGLGGALSIQGTAYYNFISDITNGYTSLPTSFTSSQLTTYFSLMNTFLQQNQGYANDIINPALNPSAMFSLISSSPCFH